MKKSLSSILLLIFFATSVFAQEGENAIEKKGFLIIYAGKDYNLAKRVSEEAHKRLGYEIDYRDHEYNKTLGLSIPKDECEKHGFEFPSYIQRGRDKNGNFISIEYTNAYNNFTEGYYIVVVASYPKGDVKLKETLNFVKKYYKSAYVKNTDVYVGCLH